MDYPRNLDRVECPLCPDDDWLELARKEFLKRWYAENGDDYEDSVDAYGEAK